MAAGRAPPGKCLWLFILLVDTDSQGQETSGVAFRTEALIWGRLKVSFRARVSASTEWGKLFVAASPSAGTAGQGLQLGLGSGGLQRVEGGSILVP